MSEYEDAREKLTFEPKIGMTFVDTRHGHLPDDEREYLTVVYMDEAIALLRSNKQRSRGEGDWYHRIPSRERFERQLGAGRLKPIDENPSDVPAGPLTAIQRRAESLESNEGRKSQHFAEALNECVTLLTTERDESDRTSVDFKNIEGVGQTTANNLRESGYSTRGDVQRASDEELLDVHGVGNSNLKNIRDETE